MVLQQSNYISKQKKKYLIHSCIWTVVVFATFGIGICVAHTRANLFTISACLFAIVAALFITRWIGFNQYKECNSEWAKELEESFKEGTLFNCSILIQAKEVAYFEHILMLDEDIYFITYNEDEKKLKPWLISYLRSQGVKEGTLHLVNITSDSKFNHFITKLKRKNLNKNQIATYDSKIIHDILM